MRALVLLALLVVLGGCLKSATFNCADQSDCMRGGEQGTCEATGFCSFVDGTCPEGRRYGDLSGSLAGTCVGDQPPVDAPPDNDAPDAPDGPPAAPFCDAANEPALVGCWEFENVLTDGSGDNNNLVVTAGSVSFAAGKVGLAAELDAASHIAAADTLSLSPTSLTIEGWINLTALPAGRMGIVDNNNSYGFFVQTNGTLTCTCTTTVTSTVNVTAGAFTHVACTYDETTGIGTIYVNGAPAGTATGAGPLGLGDTSGAAIGGNSPSGDTLVGAIDQLRVWNVARTAQQICTAAGKVTCP